MNRRGGSPNSPEPSNGGREESSGADLPYVSEPVGPQHRLGSFSCGKPELDRWLQSSALHADAMKTGRTYVLADDRNEVVAYYTIAPHAVRREDVPRTVGRGSPDLIPVILLARLALDERVQGRGLGEAVLVDALERCFEAIVIAGGRMVVVDAIDENAEMFYIRYGFKAFPETPSRLAILASEVARILGIATT